MAYIVLLLALVGIGLIVLGAYISFADWQKKHQGGFESNELESSLNAMTKLLEALKGYPLGLQLIVFGIVLEIIAGLMGGIGLFAKG